MGILQVHEMRKLVRNRAQCKNCKDIIESKHRHDFVSCSCMIESERLMNEFPENKRYRKTISKTTGNWTKTYLKYQQSMHGISLDGGIDYQRVLFYNKNDFIDLSEWE